MSIMTYEQFIQCCERWGLNADEGYKAMCFVTEVIKQNYNNQFEQMVHTENAAHSEIIADIVKTGVDDAMTLSFLYSKLDSDIYKMLEAHNKE